MNGLILYSGLFQYFCLNPFFTLLLYFLFSFLDLFLIPLPDSPNYSQYSFLCKTVRNEREEEEERMGKKGGKKEREKREEGKKPFIRT